MNTLSIALDWTPNTNHIGIFMAQAKGYYSAADVEINILNPLDDEYQTTPGKKLETGQAQLAIAPFETVISLNNKVNTVDAVAVYAILQEDISSIVTLKSSGLSRPSLLDGQLYASYKARYEDAIVKAMVRQDGGTGKVDMIYPDKLGIWNTLLQNKAEATWIFNNWEGIEAASKAVALHQFTLKDYDIPYGYSPVIIAKKEALQQNYDTYKAFIAATKKGYAFAVEHPAEAAQLLFPHLTPTDQRNIDLMASIAYTIPYFGEAGSMGWMEETRIHQFLRWLVQQNIEQPAILLQQLFTNELLGNRP
jgi:ABC-type nitrate/sulfonate/bicarbonate transport system substrate-binding protein